MADTLRNRIGTVWRSILKATSPAMFGADPYGVLAGIFPGTTTAPTRGSAQLLQAYNDFPWVRAIVGRISGTTSALRWRLYVARKGGKPVKDIPLADSPWQIRKAYLKEGIVSGKVTEIESHPFLDMHARPNRYLSGTVLRKLTQVYMEIAGEAFLIKQRNNLGMPIGLWPVPPTWVVNVANAKRPFFTVKIGSEQVDIPDTEIFWIREINPANPAGRGVGTTRALVDELETDEFAAKFVKSFFFNHARPDILVSGKSLNPADVPRVRQEWIQRTQGFWRSFMPHFMSGELDVKILSQDFGHMQFIELRKSARDFCIQTWGLPPEELGVIADSNRATIDAAEYLYNKNLIIPRAELYREEMQFQVVTDYDERLILDYDSPSLEDKEFMLKVATVAPWSRRLDEWRKLQNLDPAEDKRVGNLVMMPYSVTPTDFDELADFDLTPEPTDIVPADPNEMRSIHDDYPNVDKGMDRADLVYKIIQRIADRHRSRMAGTFQRTTFSHRAKIDLAAIESAVASKNRHEVERLCGLPALRAAQFEDDKPVLERGAVSGVFIQTFEAAGKREGATLADLLNGKSFDGFEKVDLPAPGSAPNLQALFDLTNPHAVVFLQNNLDVLAANIANAQVRAIADIIEHAFVVGIPPAESATLIRDVIGLRPTQAAQVAKLRQALIDQGRSVAEIEAKVSAFSDKLLRQRSRDIARTETINAANGGQQELWYQARSEGYLPAHQLRRWIVTPDDRLDEIICRPMRGQEVELDEPFITPDGRQIMHPTAHPRCVIPETEIQPFLLEAGLKARYKGWLIEFEAGGNRLTVGLHHPILTARGFVPAASLNEGDYVLCGAWKDGITAGVGPDEQDPPTRADQIFQTALKTCGMPSISVPTASHYLHGDGESIQGEIEIVGTNGLLSNHSVAAIFKQNFESNFVKGHSARFLHASRASAELRKGTSAATNGGVRRSRYAAALLGRACGHASIHGVGSAAWLDAISKQAGTEGVSIYTQLARQSLLAFALNVTPQRIGKVRRIWYSDHVYDFQGWGRLYLANGIVASNCRCAMRLVFKR